MRSGLGIALLQLVDEVFAVVEDRDDLILIGLFEESGENRREPEVALHSCAPGHVRELGSHRQTDPDVDALGRLLGFYQAFVELRQVEAVLDGQPDDIDPTPAGCLLHVAESLKAGLVDAEVDHLTDVGVAAAFHVTVSSASSRCARSRRT